MTSLITTILLKRPKPQLYYPHTLQFLCTKSLLFLLHSRFTTAFLLGFYVDLKGLMVATISV
ncbi:hypothetical protein CPB83DRAFT_863393 [Crepidotus variabilis]|uniref:Uncharacterized protein n=1 Tax=Crepidotus variabilis TaxID=179855 RepID=A0A9P6E600_9AGAR|nr:hypothetical protein CPB83DRAFT_863393 [Crepidotus variabilis]